MRYVAYYRVSTERQGASGLGLDSQRSSVLAFIKSRSGTLVEQFTEVESGGRNDRVQLSAALRATRLFNATLVIAKLDRLSRDAHFLLGLEKANVPFVAVDMPNADQTTVGMMAVFAQHERKMISERTKAALAAAKKRGIKLGNPRLEPGSAATAAIARSARTKAANSRAMDLTEVIGSLRTKGHSTLRDLAAALNELGIPTARGALWHPEGVRRVLERTRA